MGLRQFNVSIEQLSAEESLRCDVDFIDFSRTPNEKSVLFGKLFVSA